MSRYLIIGGNSQLGINLAEQLRKQEKSPDIWMTSRNSKAHQQKKEIYLDLNKPCLADYAFEYTFFCAGMTSVAQCEQQPEKARQCNFINTIKLTQALSKAGSKVIFPSSSLVFDGQHALYQIEESPKPMTIYGQYKAVAESEILNLSKKNMVIRLSKILPHDYALFKHWIKQLKMGESISAFYNLTIAPITMEFACQQIIALTKKNATGIWHISAKTDISYYDIAQYIADSLHKNKQLVHRESAKDKLLFSPEFSSLDASKTDKKLTNNTPDSWQVIKEIIGRMI